MTELSFIDFKCPHCSEVVSFPDDYAGLPQACPTCSETVIVPKDGGSVGRPLPLPLTTPRLVLRRLRTTDWKDLLECVGDAEMFHYVEGRPLEEEEVLRWLDSDAHVKLTTPNQPFYLGLEKQGEPRLIGYLSLRLSEQHHLQATLNIFVNRNHQQQGYAREAIAAILQFCFRDIGLHRAAAYCDSRHAAACRLFEGAGMLREGEFRKDRFLNGQWINTVWFAKLAED